MHNSKKDGRAAGENRIIHPHLLHEEQLSPEKALEYSLFTSSFTLQRVTSVGDIEVFV